MSYASEVLADTPDVYFRLNDTGSGAGAVVDSSGNAHHLTPNNTIASATGLITTDPTNAAMTFDGAQAFWKATSAYVLSQQPLTVEFWIEPLSLALQGIVVCCGTTGGWQAGYLATSGTFRFTTRGEMDYDFTAAAAVGVRRYVVFVFDTAHDVHLYIDGAFSQTVTHNAGVGATTNTLRISGDATDDKILQCVVDEVAIYKSALSAQRISDHYTAAVAAQSVVPVLMRQYRARRA